MTDAGVGRLLVASLHQGIADVLPTRLDFYESWLNPAGLRDGRIGLAPLAAVLSFLRQEGEPYRVIATRAGEYTAQWMLDDMRPLERRIVRALPRPLRRWYAARLARRLIRHTYGGSRATVRWRRGGHGSVDIRGSLFCAVRDRSAHPLCDYYTAALRTVMRRLDLDMDVEIERCRATGADRCQISLAPRAAGAAE